MISDVTLSSVALFQGKAPNPIETAMAHNPETTVRKIFTLPKDLWGRVEDYRYDKRIPTESEAIRRLITRGLTTDTIVVSTRALSKYIKKAFESGIFEEKEINLIKAHYKFIENSIARAHDIPEPHELIIVTQMDDLIKNKEELRKDEKK